MLPLVWGWGRGRETRPHWGRGWVFNFYPDMVWGRGRVHESGGGDGDTQTRPRSAPLSCLVSSKDRTLDLFFNAPSTSSNPYHWTLSLHKLLKCKDKAIIIQQWRKVRIDFSECICNM